ncbi:homoserine dehydrogenase [Gudongella oleilytica]|uniref:homoserine dehydrogenase n=1 Tax=Gudongella oleilytica TaxID=1582259 RepID=UPI000FF89893|nr:homoserine dehydrogenase [Gudongella oleilytica]
MAKLGMLGFGTVGQGVADILNRRGEELELLIGEPLQLKKILVKNLDKERKVSIPEGVLTTDPYQVLLDEEIDIIIEVTGDLDDSYIFIKKALQNGKHVVTANKAVVSAYFEELSYMAEEKGLHFLYEASAGGGIPFIKPLKDAIRLNKVESIRGILNGTCNFILSKMTNEGLDYSDVLREAQALGYAEADPSADVEGTDTMRKLRIIGTLALGASISEDDIICDGIDRLSAYDIEKLKERGYVVKLIGEAREADGGFSAIVQPTAVPLGSSFAGVGGAMNSVCFSGDNAGALTFTGAGAGMLPTANAVLSDVIDCILNTQSKSSPLRARALQNRNESLKGSYYVRFEGGFESEVLEELPLKEVISKNDPVAAITGEIRLDSLLELTAGLNTADYSIVRVEGLS